MSIDLNKYRAEFPITEHFAFLSHAASSPLSRRIARTVTECTDLLQNTPTTRLFPQLIAMLKELRQRAATLINARSWEEIAIMNNTAFAINMVASSLPLRPGDNVIVLDGDYPANVYPWQQLAYKGVLTKMVPQVNGGLDLNALEARIDRRTRVIALSTVMFATGFRNDIASVGKICKERGIYFVVDGIQSLGVFPMDVQACNIDFLAAGSQKWLLSLHGSGFLYARRECLDDLDPTHYVGAGSSVSGVNFLDYNLTFPPTADRFHLGTQNFVGAAALNTALELLLEVGIDNVSRQVHTLIDALINDLSERGFPLVASTAPEHRSGIVVAEVADPNTACQRLDDAGIIATVRGRGVRFAPHFYNSLDEIMRVGEVLDGSR